MTLVNSEELSQYMGNMVFKTTQKGIIETVILPGVQQELETYLNRPVEPMHVREALEMDEMGYLWFGVTPVYKILSVRRTDGNVSIMPTYTPLPLTPDDQPREWDTVALGMSDQPFRYQVGASAFESMWPTLVARSYYVAEYIGGYNGYVDQALKIAIIRVAAREVEMQFDDTQTIRGGDTEAASRSDSRTKGWTGDELSKFDRLRRRVVV